jgi:hypothetical protein
MAIPASSVGGERDSPTSKEFAGNSWNNSDGLNRKIAVLESSRKVALFVQGIAQGSADCDLGGATMISWTPHPIDG